MASRMTSRTDSSKSGRPHSRRSIAYVPRPRVSTGTEKENATANNIGPVKSNQGTAKSAFKDKKSRSKSLGPGGLDALQDSNGNRRQVRQCSPQPDATKNVRITFTAYPVCYSVTA